MYQHDRQWESRYVEKVKAILRKLLHHLVRISIASYEKDTKEATDFTIEMKGLGLAGRLRRPTCKHRDFTLRSDRTNGAKTELAKIIEGFASRYFYGWIDHNDEIAEWILVDLDKMRDSELFTIPRKPTPNRDGTTSFVSFSIKELIDAGCLLEYQLSPETLRRIPGSQATLRRPSDNTTTTQIKQTLETLKTADPLYGMKHPDPPANSEGA
jgi:hypothetical protein